MSYANPKQRRKLIADLRDLAEFLETRPEIPAPNYADTWVFPPKASDAAMLGRRAKDDDGHYMTMRSFGPVAYHAVAISAARTARYAAWDSYRDAVTPADSTER